MPCVVRCVRACGVCVCVCASARAQCHMLCGVCTCVCVCARAHAHNAMRVKAVSTVDWTVSPTVNRTVSLKDKAGGPH